MSDNISSHACQEFLSRRACGSGFLARRRLALFQ
jgi:hypothetical protein